MLGPIVGGKDIKCKETFQVRDPYDGAVVEEVGKSDIATLERAFQLAEEGFRKASHLPCLLYTSPSPRD